MKHLIFLAACLLSLSLSAPLHSQDWVKQNSTATGDIFDLATDGNSVVIGAAWIFPGSAEIVRSTNGGATWSKPFSKGNMGLTAVTLTSNSKFVATGGTNALSIAYQSGTNGMVWSRSFESSTGAPSLWCVTTAPSGQLFSGGGKGAIAKSTDNGNSWNFLQPMGDGSDVIDIEFATADTGFAVVAVGTNWLSGKRMYRTTDAGVSWSPLQILGTVRAVRMSSATNGIAVGATGSGPAIWQTSDGGSSWITLFQYDNSSMQFEDAAFDPNNPYVITVVGGNIYGAGGKGLIVYSKDGGSTWAAHGDDFANALLAVTCISSEKTVCSGMGGGVYTSNHPAVPKPVADLVVDAPKTDVKNVEVGKSHTFQILLKTGSAAWVQIDSIAVSGTRQNTWSLNVISSLPTKLTSIDAMQFELVYTPLNEGVDTATVSIYSNDIPNGTRKIKFSGSSVEVDTGRLQSSLVKISFKGVQQFSNNESKFILKSTSKNPIPIQNVMVNLTSGENAFEIRTDPFLPFSVGTSDEVEVTVKWSPTVVGTMAGTVDFYATDPVQSLLSIPISGTVTEAVSVGESGESRSQISCKLVGNSLELQGLPGSACEISLYGLLGNLSQRVATHPNSSTTSIQPNRAGMYLLLVTDRSSILYSEIILVE